MGAVASFDQHGRAAADGKLSGLEPADEVKLVLREGPEDGKLAQGAFHARDSFSRMSPSRVQWQAPRHRMNAFIDIVASRNDLRYRVTTMSFLNDSIVALLHEGLPFQLEKTAWPCCPLPDSAS
jgi:hypothetical protein